MKNSALLSTILVVLSLIIFSESSEAKRFSPSFLPLNKSLVVHAKFGSKDTYFKIKRVYTDRWEIVLQQPDRPISKFFIKKRDYKFLVSLFKKIKKPYHQKNLCSRQYVEIKYGNKTKIACYRSKTPTARKAREIVNLLSSLF